MQTSKRELALLRLKGSATTLKHLLQHMQIRRFLVQHLFILKVNEIAFLGRDEAYAIIIAVWSPLKIVFSYELLKRGYKLDNDIAL